MKNKLKILSLVFGGTSLLVSVEGAKAAVMIPVTCQKMQVGTINVDGKFRLNNKVLLFGLTCYP